MSLLLLLLMLGFLCVMVKHSTCTCFSGSCPLCLLLGNELDDHFEHVVWLTSGLRHLSLSLCLPSLCSFCKNSALDPALNEAAPESVVLRRPSNVTPALLQKRGASVGRSR